MPYKDPLKAKEYRKKYRAEHIEKYKEYEKSPSMKETRKKYWKSLAGKKTMQKYYYSTKGQKFVKGYRKSFYYSDKGQKYMYEQRLKTKGLSLEGYNELFKKQNGVCAICLTPPQSHRRLCIDHDHKCCVGIKSCGKCIRGLLCDDCNHALGSAKDSIKILENAVKYLNLWLQIKKGIQR